MNLHPVVSFTIPDEKSPTTIRLRSTTAITAGCNVLVSVVKSFTLTGEQLQLSLHPVYCSLLEHHSGFHGNFRSGDVLSTGRSYSSNMHIHRVLKHPYPQTNDHPKKKGSTTVLI